MEIAAILAIISTLVKFAPTAIEGVSALKQFGEVLFQEFNGRALTDPERTLLYAGVDAQYAKLQTPLPPAQKGDPDYDGP